MRNSHLRGLIQVEENIRRLISHVMSVNEVDRFCGYRSEVQVSNALNEHDRRLSIVDPADTGKTTTLINTIGEIINTSRV